MSAVLTKGDGGEKVRLLIYTNLSSPEFGCFPRQRRSNIEHLSLHLTYDDRELEAIPFARPMTPSSGS